MNDVEAYIWEYSLYNYEVILSVKTGHGYMALHDYKEISNKLNLNSDVYKNRMFDLGGFFNPKSKMRILFNKK